VLWEVLLGFFGAVLLIVLLSLLLTALTSAYSRLIENHFSRLASKSELISRFARFAAVITLLLLISLSLFFGI
jgi:Trk-type K+ transport system membrane component